MSRLAGVKAAFTNGGIAKSGTQTLGSMAGFLTLSLISGVMTARLLGAGGRGEIAVVITLGQTIGWLISAGCFQAVVAHNSRHPETARANTTTWLLIALPMGALGVVIGQLLVAPLFAAQTEQTQTLARLWLLLVPLMPMSEALGGAIVADHDFAAANLLRLLQQVITVALYIVLWLAGEFSVQTVLLTQLVVITSYLALLAIRASGRVGFARPRRDLAKSGLSFGLRAQASNIGGQLNARLDLLIMPAFLAASQVGLYAVAASVSSLIVSLAGSLSMIVLPVAARGGQGSERRVARLFHGTIVVGVAFALPVALLAPQLLTLVYSSAFAGAGAALRILAPGAVLFAMSNIVVSGLLGQHRPATAALSQIPGIAITVVGLVLFLSSGGIVAAAIISTVAYGISLLVASILFLRRSELSAGELFNVRPTARLALARLAARVNRPSTPAVAEKV